jgi:hypothetical protein
MLPAAAGKIIFTTRCLPSWLCSIYVRITGATVQIVTEGRGHPCPTCSMLLQTLFCNVAVVQGWCSSIFALALIGDAPGQ